MMTKEEKLNSPVKGFRLMLGYTGLFLIFIGIITFIPLIVLLFYPSNGYAWWFFYIPSFLSVLIGGILFIPIKNRPFGNLTYLENATLIVFVWVVAILVSALPYYIWGHVGGPNAPVFSNVKGIIEVGATFLPGGKKHIYHSFSNCVFESVSGFSSTGLTLFPTTLYPEGTYTYNFGLFQYKTGGYTEFLPNCEIFFFHRSIMTFTGGIGLVLILSSAINKRSSFQLYLLEGHNDKLLPNLLKSARNIIYIYVFFFLFGTIFYCILGVSVLDAICYSMAGISTGGFTSHATSISFFTIALGGIRGRLIEVVTILVMFFGMLPFIIHHFIYTKQFKKVFLHYETFVFFGIVALFLPFFIFGFSQKFSSLDASFRHGIFEFTSFISTTGFSSIDGYSFQNLNSILFFSMIIVTIIGGFTGSTAGGIKLYRLGDVFISLKETFSSSIALPEEMRVIKVYKFGEKRIVTNDELKRSIDYILLYLLCVFVAVVILIFNGFQADNSIFEVCSAFSGLGETTGLSLFAATNHKYSAIWTLIVSMFLGRLEIQIVFIFFFRLFKHIQNEKNIYKPQE